MAPVARKSEQNITSRIGTKKPGMNGVSDMTNKRIIETKIRSKKAQKDDHWRLVLWNLGKPVPGSERIKCNRETCRDMTGIREFEYGFFCRSCFMELVECSTPGCENLAVGDTRYDMEGRCRTCEFDYEPEYIVRHEGALADAPIMADGNISRNEINAAADKFLKKHGVHTPDPSKNWFPQER